MDNASIHKGEAIRDFLYENNFELLFLPVYSPQLNPIEEVFSAWKHHIKIQNSLTTEDLMLAINNSSFMITTEHAINYFDHMRSFILKGIREEDF